MMVRLCDFLKHCEIWANDGEMFTCSMDVNGPFCCRLTCVFSSSNPAYPICSMYGIFIYIYPKICPNVGKYSIVHGNSPPQLFRINICGWTKHPAPVGHYMILNIWNTVYLWYPGWWYTYPSDKWWSSSVGMMTLPIWWESHNPAMFQSPPTIYEIITLCKYWDSDEAL